MTPRDKQVLEDRYSLLRRNLKDEQSLPKNQRNEREIGFLKLRLQVIGGWLGKHKPEEKPKAISKEEFKEQFKKEFEIPTEADGVIIITDIEMLRSVWPNIQGKNISVQVPSDMEPDKAKEILREAKKLAGENLKRQKGFRP